MASKLQSSTPIVHIARLERRYNKPKAQGKLIIEYNDIGGGRRSVAIPAEARDKPLSILNALRSELADLPHDTAQALAAVKAALAVAEHPSVFELTDRTGWHGDSFVLPRITVGPLSGRLRFDPPDGELHGRGVAAGTMKKWKMGLSQPCRCSSILTFAIAAAFAGPLAKVADLSEGVIFQFTGTSGTGKTTVQRAAMSVYGATDIDLLPTFDATGRGLEELCASFNDTAIALDEVNRAGSTPQVREKLLSEIAYKIPSGKGRMRAAVVSDQGLANLRWRVIILGSSEQSFYEGAAAGKRQMGEGVRLAEIPVPKPDLGGIFPTSQLEPAERRARGHQLTDMVDRTIRSNYGLAIVPFIEHLVERGAEELKGDVHELMAEFSNGRSDLDTVFAQRLATKFALVCASGRLAARVGVAPFTEERCHEACSRLFGKSLAVMMQNGRMSAERFAKAVLDAASDASRIPVVEEGQRLPEGSLKPLGIARSVRGTKAILIQGKDLVHVANAPVDTGLLDELDRQGAIILTDAGKRCIQPTVKGWPEEGRVRFYAFRVDRLTKLAGRLTTTA